MSVLALCEQQVYVLVLQVIAAKLRGMQIGWEQHVPDRQTLDDDKQTVLLIHGSKSEQLTEGPHNILLVLAIV